MEETKNPDNESAEQVAIRRGRALSEMNPAERLDWIHAASPTPVEESDESSRDARSQETMTPAARAWLKDWKVDELSPEMRAQFDWLNSAPIFRKEEAPVQKRAAGVPVLNPSKMESLSPTHRLAILDHMRVIKEAMSRPDTPANRHALDVARTAVRPYLDIVEKAA